MEDENGDNNINKKGELELGEGELMKMKRRRLCCVLGGRGFIGKALVERLLKNHQNWMVRIADSSSKSIQIEPCESILADALDTGRASYFHVDVRRKSTIIDAIEGVSTVFYFDSLDSFPHDFYFCYNIIVQGTKNILSACRECKVERLIYNSSADVIFDDAHDIIGGDESLPFSGQLWDMVADLRAQAEALVLSANDVDGLLTCALRPCNVFGPGEKKLIPLLVNMAKSNWAKFIIGSGNNLSDFTYIDNVAHAHIRTEESLAQSVAVSGKVFFITNLEPMQFWVFASILLAGLGYQRPVISLPGWVVRCVLSLIKLLHVKSDSGKLDPCVSVYNVAALASRTRTFSCSAAQKHIEYSPVVSMDEGITLTVDSFSHTAIDLSFTRYNCSDKPSKMDMLLGSGKVADILLWREEKKTFFCFLLLAFLYYWFFLSGRTFISSAAKLLLLTIVMLFGHHILPAFGVRIPRLSSSCFEISEVDMRNSFFTLSSMWNMLDGLTKLLAQGEDLSTFLKVAVLLYICKLIVPRYLTVAIGLALVLSFTLCFIYDQYEEQIDDIAGVLFSCSREALNLVARKLPVMPFTDKRSNR